MISGWGATQAVRTAVCTRHEHLDATSWIPRGNGRSYGDSALQAQVLSSASGTQIHDFDPVSGVIRCGSGATLMDILLHVGTYGWFLPVTPGTRYVSVGGAVAADVHGKNHHQSGCFSAFVRRLELLLPNGDRLSCSAEVESEWFRATCGGMGLTGFIWEVELQLVRVPSYSVTQWQESCDTIFDAMQVLERVGSFPYSVAWVDLLSDGLKGRSVVMYGDFAASGSEKLHLSKPFWRVPDFWPGTFIQAGSVRVFNGLYFQAGKGKKSASTVPAGRFFYPLDALSNWNRLYGGSGFRQYQCIVPKAVAAAFFAEVVHALSTKGVLCTLAVLKQHGAQNDNLLSFPMDGYSLAMDFKITADLNSFFDVLDALVVGYNGRLNLCKDDRMTRRVFDAGYVHADAFREFRRRHQLDLKLRSLQSQRLEL